MTGTFADDYWNAAATELETAEGMGAYDVVDQTYDINVIDST